MAPSGMKLWTFLFYLIAVHSSMSIQDPSDELWDVLPDEDAEEESAWEEPLHDDEAGDTKAIHEELKSSKYLLLDESNRIENLVEFVIYSRTSSKLGRRLKYLDARSLRKSGFDFGRQTVFITHGWHSSVRKPSCQMIKKALMQTGDYNVVLINWSHISKLRYTQAVRFIRAIGKHVAKMLDFLESQGLDANKVRLVGHSAGAHVVGIAGFYAFTPPQYVVGLDPAGPLFENAPISSRISPASGKNVEAIHTNAGVLGIRKQVGHADFYPNDGMIQPGCTVRPLCSHQRAYEYYPESLLHPDAFVGARYNRLVPVVLQSLTVRQPMGTTREHLPYEGAFYVKTASEPPYGFREFRI